LPAQRLLHLREREAVKADVAHHLGFERGVGDLRDLSTQRRELGLIELLLRQPTRQQQDAVSDLRRIEFQRRGDFIAISPGDLAENVEVNDAPARSTRGVRERDAVLANVHFVEPDEIRLFFVSLKDRAAVKASGQGHRSQQSDGQPAPGRMTGTRRSPTGRKTHDDQGAGTIDTTGATQLG
jgi:hypothetical protein